jgi:hypothetical protein
MTYRVIYAYRLPDARHEKRIQFMDMRDYSCFKSVHKDTSFKYLVTLVHTSNFVGDFVFLRDANE